MSNTGTSQKSRRENRIHGHYALKRAVMHLGHRAIDGRTETGKALAKWRADLIRDLGGDASTQELALVDLAVKSKLLLDSIDTWLLTQPTLINKRKKSVLSVVRERQQLADGLAKYLAMLGLERRSKQVSLQDYVQQKYGNSTEKDERDDVQVRS